MSCYNASQYLPEAIASTLRQTYSDYEFILINDGSTDDTLGIIKRYAKQDHRIIVIDKGNTGLVHSLNVGLDVARGEWIARLDADDISLPDRFEKQLAFLDNSHSVVLVGAGCTLIDEHGTLGPNYHYPSKHNLLVNQICRYGSPFPHSSAMFHRQTAMSLSGYNPRFVRSQDADLWLRLSEFGEIACLFDPLVKIRKHTSNISNYESGSLPMIMGMAARICHLIRSKGAKDPSQDNDAAWNQFVEWLTGQIEQESCFEARRQWSNMRHDFYSSIPLDGKLRAALTLTRRLLTSGHVCQIIKNRLFSSNLHLLLANEWTQVNATKEKSYQSCI